MNVELLVSEVQPGAVITLDEHARGLNIGLDWFEPGGLDLVHRLTTAIPSEASEAQRLMDDTREWLPGLVHPLLATLTNEPTLPHPLLGVTATPTIIDQPIDTLIREMIGWQTHEVPGGWTLKTPPRSTPRDWTERKGVIRPQFSGAQDHLDPSLFCGLVGFWPSGPSEPFHSESAIAFYERVGIPQWLIDERQSAAERRARAEGRSRSGKESVL